MDAVFGEKQTVNGEVWIPIRTACNKPMFKQLNNVTIDEISSDNIVFNIGDKDLNSFDDAIISAAKEHKVEWFGRDVADRVIDNAYQSAAQTDIFTTSPLIRTNAASEQAACVKCFDHEKNPVNWEDVKPGTGCNVVVELKRLWFVKRTFGPEWFSVQVKLHKPPEPEPESDPYDDYLFQDDE